jgi:hypothetical protein
MRRGKNQNRGIYLSVYVASLCFPPPPPKEDRREASKDARGRAIIRSPLHSQRMVSQAFLKAATRQFTVVK